MTLARRVCSAAVAALIATGGLLPTTTMAQSARTVSVGSEPELVNLPRGSSFAVDLPADAHDVIISDPKIAEALTHSPRRITVIGLAPGQTDAVFLDAAGRTILSLRVRVDAGVYALQDTINRIAPGSQAHAEAVNDSIILTGLVTSPAEADRVVQVARAFVSAPEKVLNMLTVAGSDQVTLKVRVVEVERTAVKQLGLSSDVIFNSGSQSISFGRINTYGVNNTSLGGGGACYGQTGARTTSYNATNTGRTQTGTDTTGANIANTITGSNTTDLGTALTTSDGRTLTFNTATPGTLLVQNPNGTTATLVGDDAASYLRSTVTGANNIGNVSQLGDILSQAANSVPGTVTGSAINAVVRSIVGAISGNGSSNAISNSLGQTISNTVSSAYQTITGNNATACLQAFERVGLVRTLAEPNLTSVNGESATFLAGGEFPVPIARDREGQITVEYKPYGVSLAFRPIVQSGGNISMQVSVEVSELSSTGALTIGAGTVSSITLPGLSVRRSMTTVELPSGGSMMIAGMLQEDTRQTVDSLPGVTALPVLGSLFRSRDFLSGETELVVIVEPYIVRPTTPGQMQSPADGLRIATDIQTTLFGQLNQAYGTPAPTAVAGVGWQGPVGYVIE
ncbi:hypothetical protein BH09PSE1_BH09PSE1_17910 [soil metagenome]